MEGCLECGAEIKPPRKKFCGTECKQKWHYDRSNSGNKYKHIKVEGVCKQCGKDFTVMVVSRSEVRTYCTKECYYDSLRQNKDKRYTRHAPVEKLVEGEIRAAQLIWQTFGYHPLQAFFGGTDLWLIYNRMENRPLFHEWLVYTILFQSHLEYRYENIILIPNMDKIMLQSLYHKFRITLQDSEAFEEDRRAYAAETHRNDSE